MDCQIVDAACPYCGAAWVALVCGALVCCLDDCGCGAVVSVPGVAA